MKHEVKEPALGFFALFFQDMETSSQSQQMARSSPCFMPSLGSPSSCGTLSNLAPCSGSWSSKAYVSSSRWSGKELIQDLRIVQLNFDCSESGSVKYLKRIPRRRSCPLASWREDQIGVQSMIMRIKARLKITTGHWTRSGFGLNLIWKRMLSSIPWWLVWSCWDFFSLWQLSSVTWRTLITSMPSMPVSSPTAPLDLGTLTSL